MDSFIAAFLVSILASIAGTLTVFRKAAFLVAGISHSALAGVALYLFLLSVGIKSDYFLLASIFAIFSAILASRFSRYDINTGIAITFSLSMAIAVLFLSFVRTFAGKVWAFLFGDIFLVTYEDILYLLFATLVTLFFFSAFYSKIIFFLFDPEGSEASGIKVSILDAFLVSTLALATVSAIKAVGAILTYAIFISPAAAALRFSKSVPQTILYSFLFVFSSLLAGIYVSMILPVSASAVAAIILSVLYLATNAKF